MGIKTIALFTESFHPIGEFTDNPEHLIFSHICKKMLVLIKWTLRNQDIGIKQKEYDAENAVSVEDCPF